MGGPSRERGSDRAREAEATSEHQPDAPSQAGKARPHAAVETLGASCASKLAGEAMLAKTSYRLADWGSRPSPERPAFEPRGGNMARVTKDGGAQARGVRLVGRTRRTNPSAGSVSHWLLGAASQNQWEYLNRRMRQKRRTSPQTTGTTSTNQPQSANTKTNQQKKNE